MQQFTASYTMSETAAWRRGVQIAELQDLQSTEVWGNREQWQVGGDCVFHTGHWQEAPLGTELCLQEDSNILVVNYKW